MTDDFGLHDRPEPPGRPAYGRRRAVVGLVALAVVAAIVVAVALIAGVAQRLFGAPADYDGRGFGRVIVQVHPGDTAAAIGETLDAADVVRSVDAFTDAANAEPRARSIGPGYYKLRKHMKASLALALLLDPSSLVQSRVVVPEGLRLRDIVSRIVAATDITRDELQRAIDAPQRLGLPAWAAGRPLEGFLFPATYDFPPGTTAEQALRAMVARFDEEAASVDLVGGARRLGFTPYQVLTLASIVEREGRVQSDFPLIAEVFYNRLARGMRLDSDATLFYVLPPDHGGLTVSELKMDSPYNTRLHPGLPPTPIASPGRVALEAALHPAKGPYLYFVTIDKSGRAAFATTLEEFNKLVARSRANGVS